MLHSMQFRSKMLGEIAIGLSFNIFIVSCQFNAKNDGLNEDENYEAGFHSADQDSVNSLSETIPGEPSSDYPTYTSIPRTAFSCEGRTNWGYYADVETGCQAFHVCEGKHSKSSFLCPIGSIFNQRHLICDWWYNFDCGEAISPTAASDDFNNQPFDAEDQSGFDLNIAVPPDADTPDQKILSRTFPRPRKQFQVADKFRTRRYSP